MKRYFSQERTSLTIGSVDQHQGTERSVVIASLVRSARGAGVNPSSVGFLEDPKRITSMLTRGKHLVILVGSEKHFRGAGCQYWNYLLDKATIRDVVD